MRRIPHSSFIPGSEVLDWPERSTSPPDTITVQSRTSTSPLFYSVEDGQLVTYWKEEEIGFRPPSPRGDR